MSTAYAEKQFPVQKKNTSTTTSVFDASSQSKLLQRKADTINKTTPHLMQREIDVVQRVAKPFPIDTFVYRSAVNNDLKYSTGLIVFDEYNNDLKSSNFTGCLMVAFKFNDDYSCKKYNDDNNSVDVKKERNYIAHAFMEGLSSGNDTRVDLTNAERNNLITISAMYKPNCFMDKFRDFHNGSIEDHGIIGKMTIDEEKWKAAVYAQTDNADHFLKEDKNSNKSEPVKTYNSDELELQTLATKAFIYASILVNKKTQVNNHKKNCLELIKIAKTHPQAIVIARDILSTKDEEISFLKYISDTNWTIEDINLLSDVNTTSTPVNKKNEGQP